MASQIATAQTLKAVQAQVQQNVKDLPAAVAANQVDGTPEGQAAFDQVKNQVFPSVVTKAQVVQTPAADAVNGKAAAATPTAAATNNNGKASGKASGNTNGKKNKGNN